MLIDLKGMTAMDFGIGLGPYIFGDMIPSPGYQAMYLILAGSVLFSIFLYYLLHGRYVPE